MPERVGFHLSRVLVVESLKYHDVKTGLQTAEFARSLDSAIAAGIPIEYLTCDSADDFIGVVHTLKAQAIRARNFPLLHLECHGDNLVGLEFRDNSTLSWPQLSALISDLNAATRFNLLAIFSACYGGYFLSRISTIDPCPCYAMLAPTEAVRPHEILGAFRGFYSELFSTMNAGRAMLSASRMSLEEGSWMPILAESWYEHVVINYIEQHCTRNEMRARTLRTTEALRATGVSASMRFVKQGLIQENRSSITGKFFDKYFLVDQVPENASRFASVRRRLEKRIDALRATGRYGI